MKVDIANIIFRKIHGIDIKESDKYLTPLGVREVIEIAFAVGVMTATIFIGIAIALKYLI